MKFYEAAERNEKLLTELLEVWKSSVRATHLFLSDAEVEEIKTYVPRALAGVEYLIVACRDDAPIAFMGTENGRLEMLFIAPNERGKGIGRLLLEHGIQSYGITELTVNEQNQQAAGFYEHMGFKTYKRTPLDEAGDPYPLLYMRLR